MTARRVRRASVLLALPLVAAIGCSSATKLPEAEARALATRRAAVFAGADAVDLSVADGSFTYEARFDRGGELSVGTAAPVTADGHLLSAAHLLDVAGGTICVYLFAAEGRSGAFLPADLVYLDAASDLAVLKLATAIPRPFALADGPPAIGATVISTAMSHGSQRGELLAVVVSAEGRTRLEFERKTKVGDSGGVLLDSDGRAIGVIVQGGLDVDLGGIESVGVATAVDAAWWAAIAPQLARDPRFRPAAEATDACRLGSATR